MHSHGSDSNQGNFLMKYLLSGVASSTSTFFTNPVDVVKVQMQLAKGRLGERPTMFRTGLNLFQSHGIPAFWRGYPAALLRSFTFTATRVTAFEYAKLLVGAQPGTKPSLTKNMIAGVTSGVFASVIANPMELVKVRMQAHPERYKNVVHAFYELIKTEGTKGISTGMAPHAFRGGINNAAQLGSYDYIKNTLKNNYGFEEGFLLQFVCSMCAGLISTTTTSPFDVIKTQIMIQSAENPSVLSALGALYRKDGISGFFRGWTPNYARIGPQSVITLLILEQLRKLFHQGPL